MGTPHKRKVRAREKDGPPIDEPDDNTPGCAVCGLRGEHECLTGDALNRYPAEWHGAGPFAPKRRTFE